MFWNIATIKIIQFFDLKMMERYIFEFLLIHIKKEILKNNKNLNKFCNLKNNKNLNRFCEKQDE